MMRINGTIQEMSIQGEGMACAKALGLEYSCCLLTCYFPLCRLTLHCGKMPRSLLDETGGLIMKYGDVVTHLK